MWSGDDKNHNGVAQNDVGNPVDGRSDSGVAENSQPTVGRERSLSVPCASAATDVETVVTKAKRASSFLWMLLHSQSCCLAANRCTHHGCADAKLVHLHLKTCPAGHDFPCPTRYAGCLQARKLLAHYRRCRNIRARQIGQAPAGKNQHVCLICSMVARQARSLLDSNSASKASVQQGPVHKRSANSSKCQVGASFTFKAKVNSGTLSATSCKSDSAPLKKRILASFTLSDGNNAEPLTCSKPKPVEDWNMPPPAPRNPRLLSQSAPASPLGGIVNGTRIELKSDGVPQIGPIPLLRKRSESMGSDLLSGNGRRAVAFAPRTESRPVDVAVELESSDPVKDGGDVLVPQGRARSASCHVLSGNQQGGVACGTIYELEEIGQSASCMDE